MKNIGQIFRLLGIGLAIVAGTGLVLALIFYTAIQLPAVDNKIVDINIKAVRERLRCPYLHSKLDDRWEIFYARFFGPEMAMKKFPPRKLEPIDPALHPWGKMSRGELIVKMAETAVKIGMPVLARP